MAHIKHDTAMIHDACLYSYKGESRGQLDPPNGAIMAPPNGSETMIWPSPNDGQS